MSIYFDGSGFSAERLCAEQFNGTLTSEKEWQYKDVDLFIKGKSCSVKDQLGSSAKFNSIQIELQLINTDNNQSMKGCFYSNESDYYFWRVTTKDNGDSWVVVESEKLKHWVESNKDSLRPWTTTAYTERKNRSYGRTFNRSKGVVVTVEQLQALGKTIKCIRQ